MRTKFSYSKIVDKGFGAIGTGGDLRALDQEDFNELYSAFLEYGFLIFPNQHLNEAENIDFAKRFGSWSLALYRWQMSTSRKMDHSTT